MNNEVNTNNINNSSADFSIPYNYCSLSYYINTMPETKFDVGMTCEGCAGAIKRILGKVPGVTVIETDVAAKSVVVMHDDNVTSADIDAKLQKWSASSGKPVSLSS